MPLGSTHTALRRPSLSKFVDMAVLSGPRGEFRLPARCLIGRSALADIRLESKRSSSEHASLGCHAGKWILRDLGSSNGTSVDGKQLSARERIVLTSGCQLRFGDDNEQWQLRDIAPPDPCAVLLGPQAYQWGYKSLLVLPSPDAPEASVFTDGDHWTVDDGSSLSNAESGDIVRLPSGYFRLILPDAEDAPVAATQGPELSVTQLDISFRVGAERVVVELSQGSARLRLPPRACTHTLLALARLRVDCDASLDDAGWVSSAELAELRGSTPEKVNVDIHRLRKLFQEAGVNEAARIIERDDTKRLRIGVRRVTIVHE